jgi:hypothetical protein
MQRTQRSPEFVREKGMDQMNMVPIDVSVDNRERLIAHWICVVGVAMTNGATGTDETKRVDGEPTIQSVHQTFRVSAYGQCMNKWETPTKAIQGRHGYQCDHIIFRS